MNNKKLTEFPKEFFYFQLYFAKKVGDVLQIDFETSIHDYTCIAKDLLKISEYPCKDKKEWQALFSKDVKKLLNQGDLNHIADAFYNHYTTLPHSTWIPVDKSKLEYGMFSYNFYPNDETVNLHAGNINRGESLSSFSSQYKNRNKIDLYKLVKDVKKSYPNIKTVRCSSWINNIKSFTEIFPKTYQESLQIVPNKNFLGIWQQFLDKDGQIKEELVQEFITNVDKANTMEELTVTFPYKVICGEVNVNEFLN